MSDQLVSKCCIDRLNWHDLSGVRGRGARGYCAVREGITKKNVWPGLVIHTDSR